MINNEERKNLTDRVMQNAQTHINAIASLILTNTMVQMAEKNETPDQDSVTEKVMEQFAHMIHIGLEKAAKSMNDMVEGRITKVEAAAQMSGASIELARKVADQHGYKDGKKWPASPPNKKRPELHSDIDSNIQL